MFRNIKKYGWILIGQGLAVITTAVFFNAPALAYTDTQGDHSSVNYTTTGGSSVTPDNPGIPWLAPRTGQLTRICLWVAQTGGTAYTPAIGFWDGGWIGASTGVTWSNPGALCSTGLNTTLNVVAGHTYYIDISHSVGRTYAVYGTITDDFYRVIDIAGATNNNITFLSYATSTPDFVNWMVNWSVEPTSTAYYYLRVDYGFSSNNYSFYDQKLISNCTQDSEHHCLMGWPMGVSSTYVGDIIPKSRSLAPGQLFYARASVILQNDDYTTSTVASSTELEFVTTNDNKIINQGQPYTAPSSTLAVCDPNAGIIQAILCPDPRVLDMFVNIKYDIQNKPPFGYVTAYLTAINGITTTSSTVDTSALQPLSNLRIVGIIREGLSWGLYLMFGLWLLNRLRTFEV